MKRTTTLIMAMLMVMTSYFALSGCSGNPLSMGDEKGIWRCQYIDETKTSCAIGRPVWIYVADGESYYVAGEDVFKGGEYAFLPSHINGISVVQYGFDNHGWMDERIVYQKLYMPYTIEWMYINDSSGKRLVAGKDMKGMLSDSYEQEGAHISIFIANAYKEHYASLYPYVIFTTGNEFTHAVYPDKTVFYLANVSYDINYPNDDYKFHAVDDYDYGSLITYTPPAPIREGYTFMGWYTEPECITLWDFETDTLPDELIDETNGKIVYQETKLFAGWEANQ
ncbi:MAG: InlB B-repeat-containing protein [Clostridia bacterium]|nr:InlB B-repeat-containing protein [Clostridia bacterium]